jgi:hypothetical protein
MPRLFSKLPYVTKSACRAFIISIDGVHTEQFLGLAYFPEARPIGAGLTDAHRRDTSAQASRKPVGGELGFEEAQQKVLRTALEMRK